MATLIVTVLFGLIIAFFATQNTGVISLRFLDQTITGVPIYIAIVGALLVGLLLSWIIGLVNSITNGFTMRGKESTIKDHRKENAELTKQVHQLQIENSRLKGETDTQADDNSM